MGKGVRQAVDNVNCEIGPEIIGMDALDQVSIDKAMIDLDGTDAWIEGNVFLHAHKNGSPDTASAISGNASPAGSSNERPIPRARPSRAACAWPTAKGPTC